MMNAPMISTSPIMERNGVPSTPIHYRTIPTRAATSATNESHMINPRFNNGGIVRKSLD